MRRSLQKNVFQRETPITNNSILDWCDILSLHKDRTVKINLGILKNMLLNQKPDTYQLKSFS